jgi:hypothetical protein
MTEWDRYYENFKAQMKKKKQKLPALNKLPISTKPLNEKESFLDPIYKAMKRGSTEGELQRNLVNELLGREEIETYDDYGKKRKQVIYRDNREYYAPLFDPEGAAQKAKASRPWYQRALDAPVPFKPKRSGPIESPIEYQPTWWDVLTGQAVKKYAEAQQKAREAGLPVDEYYRQEEQKAYDDSTFTRELMNAASLGLLYNNPGYSPEERQQARQMAEEAASRNRGVATAGRISGDLLKTLLLYSTAGKAIEKLPVLGRIRNPFLRNIVAGQAADTLVQTPQVTVSGVLEKKSAGEIAKDVAAQQAIDLAGNVLFSGIETGIDAFRNRRPPKTGPPKISMDEAAIAGRNNLLDDLNITKKDVNVEIPQPIASKPTEQVLTPKIDDTIIELKARPATASTSQKTVSMATDNTVTKVKGKEYKTVNLEVDEGLPEAVNVPLKQSIAIEKVASKASDLKDISGFRAYTQDFNRNMEDVFGDNYQTIKKEILDPFDNAKKASIEMQENWLNRLKTEVVDKLGIGKDTKMSAYVQQYGEANITYDELVKRVGKEKADNIVEADKWFRKAYDELLDQVNEARAIIYPNNPDKIIPKRQNYYRHFRNLADTFAGLKNLFETPSAIDPSLAGLSDFTKPKSKFLSFAQRRGLGPFKNDAIGGFLDYIQAAAYAKHIDPQIPVFRQLRQALVDATQNSRNLNHFIEYLNDFANDLAGKTNPFDRQVQKIIPGGRTTFRAINWLNSRIKANTVLGNISSSLSQIANLPQGIAYVKDPDSLIKGAGDMLASIFNKGKAAKLYQQSGFLKERYASKLYSQFDTKLMDQPRKLAEWLLGALDEVGTKTIWSSVYRKAVKQGIANPMKHADDITRKLVAGRGIGEVPILQKSKLFQLIAPFTVEVQNLWHVQKDFIKGKDFAGLAVLYLANYVLNKGMENIRGSGVVFDPIGALEDAINEEDTTLAEKAGRLGGEVLSNIPLGQALASQLSEDVRRKYFGRTDPTRYGTGLIVTEGLKDPLFKILPPFGGNQLKKTLRGAKALQQEGVYTDQGNLRYPLVPDIGNRIRGLLFGPSAFKESREYYSSNRRPLSKNQTQAITAEGVDTFKAYEAIMNRRRADTIRNKIREIQKDTTLSKAKKEKKIKKLQEELKKLQ